MSRQQESGEGSGWRMLDPSGNLLRIGHDLYDAYVPQEP
jgi:hypothetical protein